MNWRMKNTHDSMFENLSSCHEKSRLELEPIHKSSNFRLLLVNDIITTEVYHKANKSPVHCKSQFSKWCKRNAIKGGPI